MVQFTPAKRGAGTRRRAALLGVAAALVACAVLGAWSLDRAVRRAGAHLVVPPASTVVLDRDGRLLRPFATRDGRWSLPVAERDVDPRFIRLLLATEDGRFAEHGGVDPRAALRAAAQWAWRGHIVSGASTLSMQVARLVAPRARRSLRAKAGQAVRALALERRFGKAGILDLYLRLAPYGGTLGGVRAASLAWFGHEPKHLSLAEAALLVALPQAPERRRPDRFPEAAQRARDRVLARAADLGLAEPGDVAQAAAEPVPDARRALPALAFHAAGEARAGTPAGSTVRLTLDAGLQAGVEPLVLRGAARFGPKVTGALLVVDNASGDLLADIGAADPRSAARSGSLDMARALRSPGSALKPFIYAMAFGDGIAAPETVLEDRETHYGAYGPEDFDRGFSGSVSARRALQLSLNAPAVALLDRVGPGRFLQRLAACGVRAVLPRAETTPPGLAVALGGLGLKLTDLARLYAGLAGGGEVPALVERQAPAAAPARPARSVADPASAWVVGEILRGVEPPANALAGRIAFKTGTSYGFRDALAVGFSRRFTVAVWLGRADGGSVPGLVGRDAAGPLLFDAFARLPGPVEPPPRPPGARIDPASALPAPLRRLAPRAEEVEAACGTPAACARAPRAAPALRIAYPPDGATVDLGLGEGATLPLALKAEGGAPPFTWFVNGLPAGGASLRRESRWAPDGTGFAHLSVIDAAGREAAATIRLR